MIEIGTWSSLVSCYSPSLRQSVKNSLGDFAHMFDIDAVADEFRQEINLRLPTGMLLSENDSFYTLNELIEADVETVVHSVDLYSIAFNHRLEDSGGYGDSCT